MKFFGKQKTPPGIVSPAPVRSMINQTHLLIAGATGSGKSVLENQILLELIGNYAPDRVRLVLIDPKKVSLFRYRKLPHCHIYADETESIFRAFRQTVSEMDATFRYMQRNNYELFPGGHTFVVIDEYADIITNDKKRISPLIQRIAQTGRAAKFHLIVCTQRPTREVIAGAIAVNIDSRVALRTVTRQDSVNILRAPGAELLPRYGRGLYVSPDFRGVAEIEIPAPDPGKEKEILDYWLKK